MDAEEHWPGVQLLQCETQSAQVGEGEEGEDAYCEKNIQLSQPKVKSEAAVYMAAVLEYLVAEVAILFHPVP